MRVARKGTVGVSVIDMNEVRATRRARTPKVRVQPGDVVDMLCAHLDADPLVQAPGLQVLYSMQQRMEPKQFARECVAWLRMYELRAGMATKHGLGQVAL